MIDEYNYPEDFLMDDTFKQYCEGSSKKCVLFWEDWIAKHPEKNKTINAAKNLYKILSGDLKPVDQQLDGLTNQISPVAKISRFSAIHYGMAASIFIVLFLGLIYVSYQKPNVAPQYAENFIAKKGEKKKIILPDGTLVYLNGDSKIELGENFDQKDRNVKLIGEAYFDVKHNVDKPFYVHTKDFKITVLGTAFNVKSYNNEKESAATLVRGTIRLEDNTGLNKNTIILKAGQKITYHLVKKQVVTKSVLTGLEDKLPEIEVNNLTIINKQVVESAWTNNDLIFLNNNFDEIKDRLERWFNVNIDFEDKEVAQYVYTANFKNEDILTVLRNLQQVKHFNFKQKGDLITISK
ncbi:FecR family protein [Pedobacter nototheniae]|uniref:FecR family protein n=1 Tax=Pedobacter nototheniae TaxID=2488994 RepID=UPI0029315A97|nr:FecR family protein [Pedobacter nototheniae]